MHLPIRLRLTLIFTLSMAVLLAVTGSFVYLRLGAELVRNMDAALLAEADAVAAGLGQGQQGNAFNPPAAAITQVIDARGRVVEFTPRLGGRPIVPLATLRGIRKPAYFDQPVRGIPGTARVVVLPQSAGQQREWVVAGASTQSRRQALSELLFLMLVGGPVALALAAGAGWAVAGAAMRPVERMRREADAISVSGRSLRLPIPASRDEIARLGDTLNAMLGRLDAAFERERRFVDDASHELRTPLAILKAELDLAQSRPRTNPELLAAVRSASEEVDRLTSLAETLLVYSRAESGRIPLRREPTDLDRLLHEARSSLMPRAAAAGIAVKVDPHMVTAAVDPVRVRQAAENLVSNALTHTPRGGQVHASATREGANIRLIVQDTGPGFDTAVLSRAFEPFAVGPAAKGGAGHGAGLGLAIVQAIAEAHGGRASAENPPEGGARVTLILPAAG